MCRKALGTSPGGADEEVGYLVGTQPFADAGYDVNSFQ